ncbi:MAG TPA: N-acetylmuramoyl-L-alanine amidase [Kofleriaceae bacterium]|jgi:N-acetylmuramoyl-L-alanine amidase|nr:N-acetylmuramoyl-L-alanine amidase [Kofleriaceae bacterium]
MKAAYVGIAISVLFGSIAHARPLVVIDPGHGGSNPGASGSVAGVVEKRVTLAVARRVRELVIAKGIDVVMTRDDDRTLTLRQRTAQADALGADLFISIHANASPTRAQRGYETYVLTPAGVDVDARAIRGDLSTPRPGLDATTAAVLDDVERGAAQWDAAELAASIQAHLRSARGDEGDRGVRQDAQHVLLGATMPGVLVEIGFIDHPVEGKELVDPEVQDAIAHAIADAIVARVE